jgi:hypothetical protein
MTDAAAQTAPRRAPLRRAWVLKMLIMIVVLLGFGSWGLYDAISVYPKRGERYASYREMQYLEAAVAAEREEFGVFSPRGVTVVDPAAERARLGEIETLRKLAADSSDPTSPRALRATMQVARKNWLEALATIRQLTPERTTFEDPRVRLEALKQMWAGQTSAPKGLSWYDIPSQWLIMVVCWAVALWMIVVFLRTLAQRFVFEPAAKALTIPGGQTIVPADFAERIDRRKWDKFIAFVRIRPEHAGLGGRELRFDTYRHAELEEWLLTMETEQFGSEEDGSDADAQAEAGSAS